MRYRDHRLLEPGNVVTLLSPKRGNRPKTIYTENIRMNVDGRNLELHVPTLAFGKAVEGESATHNAIINGVREPSDNPYRPYFLLLARYD